MPFGGNMKEVKRDSFRSETRNLNEGDDMVRVVLDMKRREHIKFIRPLLQKTQTASNSDLAKCCEKTKSLCSDLKWGWHYCPVCGSKLHFA